MAFALALLSLAGAARAEDAAPATATIAELLRSKAQYAGRIVRLEGQIDNCIALDCRLCPAEMTNATLDRAQCITFDFETYVDKIGGVGVQDLMNQAFRFATVTLDGRFDPACLDKAVLLCTDKASVLFGAHVTAVHSRKSVLDGLVTDYDFGPLTAPSPDDRKQMQAEFEAVDPDAVRGEVRYFLGGERAVRFGSAMGLACVCKGASCEGRWPTRFFGGFVSVANPFECVVLEKLHAGWRVMPEEDF